MSYILIPIRQKLDITISYLCANFHRDMSTVAEVMTSKQLKTGVFNKRRALKL